MLSAYVGYIRRTNQRVLQAVYPILAGRTRIHIISNPIGPLQPRKTFCTSPRLPTFCTLVSRQTCSSSFHRMCSSFTSVPLGRFVSSRCLVRDWHSPPSSRHILYPVHPALRWEIPFSSLGDPGESRLLSPHCQYESPARQGDNTSSCCWPVQAYEGGEAQETSYT